MTELELYIKNYFAVPSNFVNQIAGLFEMQKLSKDEFYSKTGKHCQKLSFIQSGFIRIYQYADGKEITQWVSSQGDFITDLSSLVFKTPGRWEIQTLTDCNLYTITQSNYNKIDQIVPQWKELEKMFIAKCFLTLEDRVFSFLSMTAENRYLYLLKNKPELFNQVPQIFIASMLGMTPETFSRIRKKISS